ncbi:hypothetical protein SteCoe_12249 [Stentor coeruleus]|uniref:DOMON domain-containing protein n=1 Tax=Stentor coeruleus TaxID=5963 RepID=A0A1R2CB86_9CILI|nr:hypothetical protein SteCoe_12249 [Stentor coeruleus]
MLVISLLLQVIGSLGAIEYFTKGQHLKYYFPTVDQVTFELWIPSVNLVGFDWIGLAIQCTNYPRNDFQADYYIAMVDDIFTDRWADGHYLPILDSELGGSSNIVSDRYEYEDYVIYTLTRSLITEDVYDQELVIDTPYMIQWAKGNLVDGEIDTHTMDNCGFEYLILADDYLDRNHDDNGKFGPWSDQFRDFVRKEDKEALVMWTDLVEEDDELGNIEDIENDFATDDEVIEEEP